MRKMLLALLAAVVVGLAIFFVADERNRLLFEPNGYVVDGRKFGVEIGSDATAAAAHLLSLSDMERYETHQGGVCAFREYSDDYRNEMFTDRSWRYGRICMISKDERVVELVWAYQFVPTFP